MNLQKGTANQGETVESRPDSASEEFENFIYLVSHDVRNSVRALLELPQWIEEDLHSAGRQIDDSLAENIKLMNIHTRRLERMLIDLLIYSRIGRMHSEGQADWATVMDAVMEQIPIPRGFHFEHDIRVETIDIGETDLLTLVSALLSNAVKHHDRTTGKISFTATESAHEQVLSISDDGPGIPERFRDKAFSVMTTLKPRDETEGSGMGLANVRKIVSHYGGWIEWPDPQQQRGLRLSLHFPKKDAAMH